MGNPRIPGALAEFDAYIGSASTYLNEVISGPTTRGESLGMSTTKLTRLTNYAKAWRSGDPLNPGVYEKHLDPETNGPLSSLNVKNFMKEFGVFFRPVLNLISDSDNIIPQDRLVLHIAEPDTTHSVPKEAITEQCNIMETQIGGGKVKIRGKITSDSKRVSLPEKATGMEIAYRVDPPYVPTDGSNQPVSKIKNPIANPNDGTTKEIYTKASVTVDFGVTNNGNIVQMYARFINVKHRNLDGPWTGPISFTII